MRFEPPISRNCSKWRRIWAPENIGDESHLQNDLGLDSMDILNFVTALHERLGVSIPEIDYPRIATVQEARAYLARALA